MRDPERIENRMKSLMAFVDKGSATQLVRPSIGPRLPMAWVRASKPHCQKHAILNMDPAKGGYVHEGYLIQPAA